MNSKGDLGVHVKSGVKFGVHIMKKKFIYSTATQLITVIKQPISWGHCEHSQAWSLFQELY